MNGKKARTLRNEARRIADPRKTEQSWTRKQSFFGNALNKIVGTFRQVEVSDYRKQYKRLKKQYRINRLRMA